MQCAEKEVGGMRNECGAGLVCRWGLKIALLPFSRQTSFPGVSEEPGNGSRGWGRLYLCQPCIVSYREGDGRHADIPLALRKKGMSRKVLKKM